MTQENIFVIGNIFNDGRIAIEREGFQAPVYETPGPHENWCIVALHEGGAVQLVPVVDMITADMEENHPALSIVRVITHSGKRPYLLMGRPIFRYREEFSPSAFKHSVADTIMPQSLNKIHPLNFCGYSDAVWQKTDWVLQWHIRGCLWNHWSNGCYGVPELRLVEVKADCDDEDYSPANSDEYTVEQMRKHLQDVLAAEIQKHGPDYPARLLLV